MGHRQPINTENLRQQVEMDRELFLRHIIDLIDLPTLISHSTPLHYAIQAMSLTSGVTTFVDQGDCMLRL